MKFLRKKIREFKYNLKFLKKNSETKINYFVNSSINSQLTNLMNHYGSDKGGKNLHHNYADFYSQLFFHKKKKLKIFLKLD